MPERDARPIPPVARREDHREVRHGREIVDPYHWLREREDPSVRRHLEAENAYADAVMRPTGELQETLFQEMKARIKETDLSVPERFGPYEYYVRTEEGKQYPYRCRKGLEPDAEEEILLDGNVLAGDSDYFALGVCVVSPDHRLLAYSVDLDGDEHYALRVRDLSNGEDLADEIPLTYYSVEWAADSRTLFYDTVDDSHRPYRLFRHVLGKPVSEDVLVHEEADRSFNLGLEKTRSQKYLLLSLGSIRTTEVRYLEADEPSGEFRVIAPRRHGIENAVEHHGDRFFILTNENAVNFKLMQAPAASPTPDHWTEFLPHRPAVMLDDVDAFAGHLVVSERERGLPTVRVIDLESGEAHRIEFPEPAYAVWAGGNPEFDTSTLRFLYTSFVTPTSVFDYDMKTRKRVLRKEQEVLGGYDRSRYRSERIFATAPDGVEVPISIVYREGTPLDGSSAMLLRGYGAYGMNADPGFDPHSLSLLDRGVILGLAHIRGGGEMGRPWYDDGKLLKKKNTFCDFIACAEHLVAKGYTSPPRLAIRGGSAGGLLMGAVANMRPDLFRAVVAAVPFVDVVNTIMDASLPLTVIEWEEWGNPAESEFYEYMMSYSPYDNVAAKAYPTILARAGLNDPRVSYWEPAKWVAKLRHEKTDANEILLKTDLGAGHGGKSGRYDRWREAAFDYAFILTRLGVVGAPSGG